MKYSTEFERNVFCACKKIPKGRVSTYKEIADFLGKKAYRAVGNALNKNKNKDVPCHRVVRSDFFVGGFAKGTKKKTALLIKEGVQIHNSKVEKKHFFKITRIRVD